MARLVESIGKPLQVKSPKILEGIFAVLGEFNQNGRRYPEKVYEDAYQELIPKIKERRLLGECDHPIDYDEVRLANVSHLIPECSIRMTESGKKVVYGRVELLDTPSGKVVQALVEAGVPIGISSRGLGNTKNVPGGVDVLQLKLITYDLVAEPSFSTAILSEAKKSTLAENLSIIESKLPLNESEGESTLVRNNINTIREALCLRETNSGTEINIKQQVDFQTLEVNALKKIIESKKRRITSDTELLKESRKQKLSDRNTIKQLESQLSEIKSRYSGLKVNHQKLQEAYNAITKTQKLEENAKILELQNTVIDLQKRLAVEKRGMSYETVKNLLEGANTEKDINSKLDSLSHLSRKSNRLEESKTDNLCESLSMNVPAKPKALSSIISRV